MLIELMVALAFVGQDATTTCRTFGGTTTCDTTARPSGLDSYNAARESAMRNQPQPRPREAGPDMRCAGGDWFLVGCTLGAHREASEAREAGRRATAARERAMTLLRESDCTGAVRAALETNDLTFAREVREFCAAAR